jgi:hypothetical protein
LLCFQFYLCSCEKQIIDILFNTGVADALRLLSRNGDHMNNSELREEGRM